MLANIHRKVVGVLCVFCFCFCFVVGFFNVYIQCMPLMGTHSSYHLNCLSRTEG